MENDAPLNTSDFKTQLAKYSPFLAEAKKRLMFTLCAFAIATFAGFFLYEKIIKLLIDFLSLKGINIVFTSPFQFINLAISCGFAVGLVVSVPLLIFQIISFLKPALRDKEYKILIKLIPFFGILFLAGFSFGALIMKWQIKIFLDKSIEIGIGNILDISRLLSTVILTSALMGIAFEFPIILLVLLKIGILKPHRLHKLRRWVYLGSFIFAILLPPDSILADIFLSLPLIVLFELTLLLDRMQNKRSKVQ